MQLQSETHGSCLPHQAKRVKMPEHGGREAGDTCDRLELYRRLSASIRAELESQRAYEELRENNPGQRRSTICDSPASTSTHNAGHPLLLCHQVSLLLQLGD